MPLYQPLLFRFRWSTVHSIEKDHDISIVFIVVALWPQIEFDHVHAILTNSLPCMNRSTRNEEYMTVRIHGRVQPKNI